MPQLCITDAAARDLSVALKGVLQGWLNKRIVGDHHPLCFEMGGGGEALKYFRAHFFGGRD